MSSTTDPDLRVAAPTANDATGTVVLVNRFTVPPEGDEAFRALWDRTSAYFRSHPGFVALRLVRAVDPTAAERWVNIATWASEADYRAAHATAEFRGLVAQEAWRAFPSSPGLYELVVSAG